MIFRDPDLRHSRFIAINIIIVVILVTSGCVASDPRLDLAGKWQDMDYPDLVIEFTIHDQFSEYFYGERTSWGTYRTNGNRITFHYDSPCGGDKPACDMTLGFEVVDNDILILTDSSGDFYHRRVKE